MRTPGESPTPAPVRFTFRKAERLCSRRSLDGLFKHGTAFNTYPLRFVVWQTGAGTAVSGADKSGPAGSDNPSGVAEAAASARSDELTNSPLAARRSPLETRNSKLEVVLSVSKRHFKRAHDRNRIKRQLREAWRHHKHELTATATQLSGGAGRPWGTLLIGVLYIGKEKPESLAYLTRRLRKGLDRLRAELPIAAPPSTL